MFQSYNPKDVTVSFNGIPITGFAEGTFIKMKRNSELNKRTVGAQGDMVVVMSPDRSGEIEIVLMQTAPSNTILSQALYLQESSRVPTVGVLTVADKSGSVLALARNAFFVSYPEIEMADDHTSRTWMFACEDLDYSSVVGSLNDPIV